MAQAHLRQRASPTRGKRYEALSGADALLVVTEWNEFREPDFAKMKKLMKAPVDLRRPQHLQPAADARAGLHLLVDRPPMSPSSSRAAPATSAATRSRRCARPGTTSSSTTICRRGTRKRSSGWRRAFPAAIDHARSRGDIRDARRGRSRAASDRTRRPCMHFAARLLVGESVQRADRRTTGPTSAGALAVLGAMADAGVRRFIFSSTCATFGEPTDAADRRDASAAADQRLRRDQAGDRAGAAAFRARLRRSAGWRCATSTPPAPIRTGVIGEDHHPEDHLIPRAIDAGARRRAADDLRRRLPDARRHLPARLRARGATSRTRTCSR